MNIPTRIVFALRALFLVCMLAVVATGCAAEPDSQPMSAEEALASELVTVDEGVVLEDADLEEYDLDEEYEAADLTANALPGDRCGSTPSCPRYSHLCCNGHCVRRVPGIRCVVRGGGVNE
jgi:hypothetical protein